jgi:hypothetical protein
MEVWDLESGSLGTTNKSFDGAWLFSWLWSHVEAVVGVVMGYVRGR